MTLVGYGGTCILDIWVPYTNVWMPFLLEIFFIYKHEA